VEWLTDETGRVRYQNGLWPGIGGTLSVADLDGDGHNDFFWYDAVSGAWATHLNRGPGHYVEATGAWPTDRLLAVGDLDGDGADDLLAYDADTGAWSRYLSRPADEGSSVAFTEQQGQWSGDWTIVGSKK